MNLRDNLTKLIFSKPPKYLRSSPLERFGTMSFLILNNVKLVKRPELTKSLIKNLVMTMFTMRVVRTVTINMVANPLIAPVPKRYMTMADKNVVNWLSKIVQKDNRFPSLTAVSNRLPR